MQHVFAPMKSDLDGVMTSVVRRDLKAAKFMASFFMDGAVEIERSKREGAPVKHDSPKIARLHNTFMGRVDQCRITSCKMSEAESQMSSLSVVPGYQQQRAQCMSTLPE